MNAFGVIAGDDHGRVRSENKASRRKRVAGVLLVLLVGFAALAYSWFYGINVCDVESAQEASAFLLIQLKEYEDVYMSAVSGTRTSLTYPLTVMQKIMVDTQVTDVPACMSTAKEELLGYMGGVIQAMQGYIAAQDDASIRDVIAQANRNYKNFQDELDRVQECAPFCLP